MEKRHVYTGILLHLISALIGILAWLVFSSRGQQVSGTPPEDFAGVVLMFLCYFGLASLAVWGVLRYIYPKKTNSN